MTWRGWVVCSLGCVLGLTLYLAGRLVRGGATGSLLFAAAIAHKLGSTEITCAVGLGSPPSPPDSLYTRSAAPLTWSQIVAYLRHLELVGAQWGAAGEGRKM